MCEFSNQLAAWLDHELDSEQTARMQPHLQDCSECQRCLALYAELSDRLTDYSDAILAGSAKRQRTWFPAIVGAAGAVAAAALMLLLIPQAPTKRISPPLPPAVPTLAIAQQTAPVPSHTIRKSRARRVIRDQNAKWQPVETDIQIAIPADAIFPPGALPEGFQFTADLSIGADGSAQGIRIIP